MTEVFNWVDQLFAFVVPISNFLWDFPTNYAWYSNIPILGQFSLAILLLLGIGVYFTARTGFGQGKYFKRGIQLLTSKQKSKEGESQLTAFLLSTASRVGAGNIVGVTGAISIGGPGAIFWMWVSAFLGMSTSFAEATLAQLFKERKGDQYVGGFTFYIQKLWGNLAWVGSGMCILYLIYNMLSIPVHTFHVFTAANSVIDEVTGKSSNQTEPIYYVVALLIIFSIAFISFGGVHKVTKVTDKIVPIMAIGYTVVVLALVVINIAAVPAFFASVFKGAFQPEAIFGGAFGVALAQGLKRGLLSNEAGMGTATQAASIAHSNHPCEQGFVQSIGVFLDTIIICSLAGFVVGAGHLWSTSEAAWETLQNDKLGLFLASARELVPGTAADSIVVLFLSIAFGLFAFTTLLGDVVYAEIAANKISRKKSFISGIRILGALFFVPLGTLTVLAGLQLDNLWSVSDFINVVLVFINVPTLIVGSKIVMKAFKNYCSAPGKLFNSEEIGIASDVWTGRSDENDQV